MPSTADLKALIPQLSARQRLILDAYSSARFVSCAAIAAKCGVASSTVVRDVQKIVRRFDCKNARVLSLLCHALRTEEETRLIERTAALIAESDGIQACSKCWHFKSFAEFPASRSSKNGKSSWCRVCTNASSRQWAKNNPERHNATGKAWQQSHPGEMKEYRARYHRDHQATRSAGNRAWAEANKPYRRAYQRARTHAGISGSLTATAKAQLRATVAAFLVKFSTVKRCANCGRLKPYVLFDRNLHFADGYTDRCSDCLPPLKTPRPGTWSVSLDTARNPDRDNASKFVRDSRAIDPDQAVLVSMLRDWLSKLPADQAQFMRVYEEEDFCLDGAARVLGVSLVDATQILNRVRSLAEQTWGGDLFA